MPVEPIRRIDNVRTIEKKEDRVTQTSRERKPKPRKKEPKKKPGKIDIKV